MTVRPCVITHNHPVGIKGAAATATAIYFARQQVSPAEIIRNIEARFAYDLSATVDEIRLHYRFNETCQETVPQTLICALSADSNEHAIRNAISIGGDSDTIAAIAGGVAEALFGIPEPIAAQELTYLPPDMRRILDLLYQKAGGKLTCQP